jgi:ABC-2 type transport system ATP-binding protein
MSVITVTDLARSYGAKRALDGLDATFPGGAMGLLGPNGAGKTTLLKTLLGLLGADSGLAEVLGLDPGREPLVVRRRVGYMPESDCWIPRLKGVRHVAFAGELAGLPGKAALARAHEVLYYVGLGEARYRPADQYSQGMRQRLRLAQALVHDPELLFLDEPTSGLDPAGRTEMLALIRDLVEQQEKHVVLSTHLLPDVEEVCSSVVVLHRGRAAMQGALDDLLRAGDGRTEIRIRGDVDAFASRLESSGARVARRHGETLTVLGADDPLVLFRAAHDAGVQVRELHERTDTLEETFLRALENSGKGA